MLTWLVARGNKNNGEIPRRSVDQGLSTSPTSSMPLAYLNVNINGNMLYCQCFAEKYSGFFLFSTCQPTKTELRYDTREGGIYQKKSRKAMFLGNCRTGRKGCSTALPPCLFFFPAFHAFQTVFQEPTVAVDVPFRCFGIIRSGENIPDISHIRSGKEEGTGFPDSGIWS